MKLLPLSQMVLAAGIVLCAITAAQARVDLPNGDYSLIVDDLQVKVMGGSVTSRRTWYKGKWQFNRAWAALQIEPGFTTGTIKSVTRNANTYNTTASGGAKLFTGGAFKRKLNSRKTIIRLANGYRWQDKSGDWLEYDNNGRLLKYGDRNNVVVTMMYDTSGNRIGVQDHFGTQVLWYEYNVDGQLIRIRDHLDPAQARQVTYQYTGTRLSSVTDATGNSWHYTYQQNQLATMTDPEGRVTTLAYNGEDVLRITQPDGRNIQYLYNYNKTKKEFFTRTSYSSGKLLEYWYNTKGELVRRDINGITVERINRISKRKHIHTNELGQQTTKDYDEWDNLVKTTYPDNSSVRTTYESKYSKVLTTTDERGITTKYDYDTRGNRIRKTEALGLSEQRITEYVYDVYGNRTETKRLGDAVTEAAKTSYTYDNLGNVKTRTQTVSATQSHTINYDVYDRMGNLLEARDGRGKIWKQTFDNKGRRTSIADPLTNITTLGYDRSGKIQTITNANNKTTRGVYNLKGQLDKIIDALKGEKRLVYNNKGQLTTVFDEENRKIERGYDAQGRINQLIVGSGDTYSINYGVIANRNVRQNQLAAINYPTFRKEFNYNNRGRLVLSTKYLDATTAQTIRRNYDARGNVISTTDGESRTIQYTYDALGRLVQITHPDITTETYTYDNRNNVLSVTNEKQNQIRQYRYDQKNRLTQELWPNGTTISYRYDPNNNPLQKIDGKSQVTKYQFDDANRINLVSYFDTINATTATKSVNITFDVLNNLTGYNDGTTSATYVFDDLQRKTSETINYGTFSKTISTGYYKNGRKQSFTDPTGIISNFAYDAENRLSQITLPGEGNITYNQYQWAAPSQITLPGGNSRTLQYDALLRVKQITSRDPAANINMDYAYNYDKADNILSKTTEHGIYNYGYDLRDRLATVDNPTLPNETFSYDDAGNRITDLLTTGNWQYNTANQLINDTRATYTYDANGSPTIKTKAGINTNYVYGLENRLREVRDNANNLIASYYYNPFGQRLWKEVAGVRTYYQYAEEGLIAEYNTSGTTIKTYGYQPHSAFGTTPLYMKEAGGYAYYQNDHLGTPQQLVRKNGQVVWRNKASSFGLANIDIELVENNLRFAGQYFDKESGLHYNYFRYYDPEAGRYITSDPIGLWGGLNTYGYVGGNPTYWIDPFGLTTMEIELFPILYPVISLPAIATLSSPQVIAIILLYGASTTSTASDDVLCPGVSCGMDDPYMDESDDAGEGENCPIDGGTEPPPPKGPPGRRINTNTSDGKPSGDRIYGDDGFPLVDIDYGHDHTGVGDPHAHDWTGYGDAGRGPPRPLGSNEGR